jgi:hypothetical protein
MALNLSPLERRLDKLTGPSPVTKPVLLVGFGTDNSPINHVICRGVRYVQEAGEAEPALIARIIHKNPATHESGVVVFIYRD